MYDLQEMLKDVTGMRGVSLTPAAGAQGEFAGVAMIRAYHQSRGDAARTEILVPDAAHGTNPATATMCGYTVREIPTDAQGDVDLDALKAAVGPQTAGLMLTNPSTLGVFERRIREIARTVHTGRRPALLRRRQPQCHSRQGAARRHGLRRHPHEPAQDLLHAARRRRTGRGPGRRVRASAAVPADPDGRLRRRAITAGSTEQDRPQSIGRLSAFMGNAGVLLRAYIYARLLGRDGMHRVADFSTLNANYLMAQLRARGFDIAFPQRRATHEFIVTLKRQAKELGVNAMDFAKRLLDHGFHAPTTYFPMLVPECLLIEPTETEAKEDLDAFVEAMAAILAEAQTSPEVVKGAPHTLPVRRLDDVRAARELDLAWQHEQ